MASPAASNPEGTGNSGLNWYLPSMVNVSGKLTLEARTWTRNVPGPTGAERESPMTQPLRSPEFTTDDRAHTGKQ
jgi:hypothetical protein